MKCFDLSHFTLQFSDDGNDDGNGSDNNNKAKFLSLGKGCLPGSRVLWSIFTKIASTETDRQQLYCYPNSRNKKNFPKSLV